MGRRKFITLLGGADAWPLAARAQQPARWRISAILPRSSSQPHRGVAGRSSRLWLCRGSESRDRIPVRARSNQVVRRACAGADSPRSSRHRPHWYPSSARAKTANHDHSHHPGADCRPAATGPCTSLARPGGNVTGVSLSGSELARKRMEVFREAVAGIRRIAVLGNAENPLHRFLWDDIRPVGPSLGLEFRLFTVPNFNELPAMFSEDHARWFRCADILVRCAVLLGAAADQRTRGDASTSGDVRGAGICRGRRADFLWAEHP